jgi:putative peptidoglycan lipid II flippase
MVVWTTRAFLIGLAGHALLEVAARGFYAQQNAITPLWAAALMAVTFTILAIILASRLNVVGIALANSLAFTGEALLLLFLLNRKFPGLLDLRATLIRVVLASIGCAVLVYVILQLPLPLPSLLTAIVAAGVGGLFTLPLIWPELKVLVRM